MKRTPLSASLRAKRQLLAKETFPGSDPYDFDCGYGCIYNDAEYDCGGSLEQVAAGWAGQSDWHEVEFNLDNYSGQDVIIQLHEILGHFQSDNDSRAYGIC